MTGTPAGETVELHPVEVDLLCVFAEVDPPFPLDVPSTGTTEAERRLMFHAACAQLAARGLADRRGPCGPAAAFVRMLHAGGGAVDLTLAGPQRSLGAVALIDGLRALLVTQSPDEPGRIVRLAELTVDDAVHELLAMVPAVVAAGVPPFTLPLGPVRQVFGLITRPHRADAGLGVARRPLSDAGMDDLLGECGVDERTAGRLAGNLREVVGSGQAGAARRTGGHGGWRRLGDDLRWIDTGRGRFRLSQHDDSEWASVNPLARNDVRSVLRELAARVRS